MKTISINLYSFSELSEESQEKVLNSLFDINTDHKWWESTYEDAANIGLKITSFDLDRSRHAEVGFTISAAEIAANILKNHGEGCETYKTAESFLEEHTPIFSDYMDEDSENYESSELENKLQDLESDFLSSLLEDYSLILQHEYEYLTSKEAILETIKANEYTFEENGKMRNT